MKHQKVDFVSDGGKRVSFLEGKGRGFFLIFLGSPGMYSVACGGCARRFFGMRNGSTYRDEVENTLHDWRQVKDRRGFYSQGVGWSVEVAESG